jgi:hypothetical protein
MLEIPAAICPRPMPSAAAVVVSPALIEFAFWSPRAPTSSAMATCGHALATPL